MQRHLQGFSSVEENSAMWCKTSEDEVWTVENIAALLPAETASINVMELKALKNNMTSSIITHETGVGVFRQHIMDHMKIMLHHILESSL